MFLFQIKRTKIDNFTHDNFYPQMAIQIELQDCYKRSAKNITKIEKYSSILLDQPIMNIQSLVHSDILAQIAEKLKIDVKENLEIVYNIGIFNKILDINEDLDSFIQYLNIICIQLEIIPSLDCYMGFICTLTLMFQKISTDEQFPDFDFKEDLQATISEAQTLLYLDIYGEECLKHIDINQDLDKEPKFYQNNLWAVYLLLVLATCALALQYISTVYYISYRGATASEIANLSTYFNLVQIPCSIFWLWISDKIGRKTVYIIINTIYLVSSFLFVYIGFIVNNQIAIKIAQCLRGIQGSGAILVPISFLMATDLAPPKIRGFVIVLVNVFSLLGALLSAPIQIMFATLGKYRITPDMPFAEVFKKISVSFIDSQITAIVFYFLNLCVAIFFLKESSYHVNLMRYLKKNNYTLKQAQVKQQKLKIDKEIIILFIGYFFSLTADNNLRVGGIYVVLKNYGFTNPSQARAFQSTVTLISMAIGIVVVIFVSKPMIKKIGECRAIVLTQYMTIFESLINFSINPPVNPNLMYLTISSSTIASIFCDSLFMQLLSMYTKAESRGRLMGIFQIGNSIGRTSSAFIIGQLQDYNYRNALVLNTIFCSVCLIFVSIVKPPIQTNEMATESKKRQLMQTNLI